MTAELYDIVMWRRRRIDAARPPWVPAGAIGAYHFIDDQRWGNVSGLTEGRASVGWDTPGGILTQFASGVPRRSSLGLRIEDARTNHIRNSSLSGAVTGSPGTPWTFVSTNTTPGLTREVVSFGTDNGFSFVEVRFSGTTTSIQQSTLYFDQGTAIAAASGQTWTSSFYVRLTGGSLANMIGGGLINRVQPRNSGGSGISPTLSSVIVPTGTWQRSVFTNTITAPTMAFVQNGLAFDPTAVGVAIDVTFRVAAPQMGQSSTVSTPIITTGSAATRLADAPRLVVPDGTYDLTVRDSGGWQTFTGQVASGGTGLLVAPRTGQTLVERAEVYPAGAGP